VAITMQRYTLLTAAATAADDSEDELQTSKISHEVYNEESS